MKFIKKNQVIVGVIALMLIAAGYLNFTNGSNTDANQLIETGALIDSEQMASIGDAQLVSTQPTDTNEISNNEEENSNENTIDESNQKEENKEEDVTKNEETQESDKTISTDEYFTKSRLERETMYSQTLESYQKMLEKSNISESQKTTAQTEIKKINEQKNAIMITENLIKTKGFEDLIIFVNNDSVNVIVKSEQLKSEEIAQIQNIITRELNAKIENIHISNKN